MSTELPQIEQLQPIETEAVTEASNVSKEEPVKEAVKEVAAAVEAEVTEVAAEIEQAATHLTTATTNNKRQSFISKIFGKKKHEDSPKEVVVQEASDEPAAATEAPNVEVPATETQGSLPKSP